VEGGNILIEFRWAERNASRLPERAQELVRIPVHVLVAQGSTAARAARAITSTIPIVMLAVGHAVGAGLVVNLARPDGHITGSTFLGPKIYAKQLELLREALPGVVRVAMLINPDNPSKRVVVQEMELAARAMSAPAA
jgi:putative ABC transport system substrate-binding protein